jgi:ligand-binding sensor domain-containing protein/signal transduction histidine kinase
MTHFLARNQIRIINKLVIGLFFISLLLLAGGNVTAREYRDNLASAKEMSGFQGRPVKFQHLNYQQGLSNNNVWSVWQDSQGFMWFGTVGGLNRFDGYRFLNYKNIPGDPESLSANLVTVVYEDQQGDLWVGTWENGLDHFDRETEEITHYKNDLLDRSTIGSNAIRSIIQDSYGVLWVGTAGGGLNRFDPENNQFIRYNKDDQPGSLTSNDVFALYEDSAGELWIGTFAGGLNRYEREEDRFWHFYAEADSSESLRGALIDALVEDQAGNLWLGTWGGGLFRFDRENYRLTQFSHDSDSPDSLSNDFVLSLAVDLQGRLWIGTDGGGVNVLDPGDTRFTNFLHHPGDKDSLSNNVVRSLFLDQEGTIWIGTWGGGIDRFSYEYNQFNHYKYAPDAGMGLSDSNVMSIYQDSQGYVWAGTEKGGLNRLDLSSGEVVVYTQGTAAEGELNSNAVRSIAPGPNGDLWVGTLGGGLNRFNPDTEVFSPILSETVGCTDVYAIASTEEDVWVGCSTGLLKYTFSDEEVVSYLPDPTNPYALSNSFVTSLLLDEKGLLWIGTFGGLNRFDPQTEKFTSYQHDLENPESITHNNITCLYQDSEGGLWVGTLGGGLNKFKPESETFTNYLEYEKQIGDAVLGITEGGTRSTEGDLELWLSTYQGLVKFSTEEGVLRVYDEADGLQGNIFNPGSVFANQSGELLFGGMNGFNIFLPDNLTRNLVPPKVVITEFSLNLEPVPVGPDSVLPQAITETETLKLSYLERVISFEFSALSYTAPEKNRYQYTLENFEDGWHEVSSDRRYVSYTNLDPGEYIFRVIGANPDGVWNEEGVHIRIVIVPPWWETWVFRVAMALAAAGVIFFGYRFRLSFLESQRRMLELLVKERTQEIEETSEKLGVLNQELEAFAFSVSHDLRAPLRALNGYHTILVEEYAESMDAEGQAFVQLSLNAVERMDKMIDAVLQLSQMTRQDLEKLPLSMSEMAEGIAKELDMLDLERVVTWKIQPGIQVHADQRVLMVVLENLIGNAYKFTKKQENPIIELGEFEEDGRVGYFVRDNGVGFRTTEPEQVFTLFQRSHDDEEFEGYGVGLAIVRRAIQKHGGSIWVESELGKGTIFYFRL